MDIFNCKINDSEKCRLICADIHDVIRLLNMMNDAINETIEILEKNHPFYNGEDFNYSETFSDIYKKYLSIEELRSCVRFRHDDTTRQINSLSEKLSLSENEVLKLQNELKNLKNDTKNESKNG